MQTSGKLGYRVSTLWATHHWLEWIVFFDTKEEFAEIENLAKFTYVRIILWLLASLIHFESKKCEIPANEKTDCRVCLFLIPKYRIYSLWKFFAQSFPFFLSTRSISRCLYLHYKYILPFKTDSICCCWFRCKANQVYCKLDSKAILTVKQTSIFNR